MSRSRCSGLPISLKMTMTSVIAVSVGLIIACAILGYVFSQAIRSSKVQELQSLGGMIAFNSTGVLTFEDSHGAHQLLDALQSHPDVLQAQLMTTSGHSLGVYERADIATRAEAVIDVESDFVGSRFTTNGDFEYVLPIEDDLGGGDTVGTLYLKASMGEVSSRMLSYFFTIGLVAVVALITSVVLSYFLQRGITQPIIELSQTAERISIDQDYSVRVVRRVHDELGDLFVAFNAMLDRVERSEEELIVAERKQADAMHEARNANRAKSQFLANMSHEIRTPLTGIIGFTDELLEDEGPQKPPNWTDQLGTVSACGKHLLTLINEILDLSKIEVGQMEVEIVPCDPQSIIADTVSILRVKAAEKGLSLDVTWASPVPSTVQADPARLRQVLMNLIGNAIKFTEHGGVRVVARVLKDHEPPVLRIDIQDSGIGIEPDRVAAIFEPFVQADNSTTRRFGGTGLGLSISRRFTELIGGSLTASSELGVGSVFTVMIPTGPLSEITFATAIHADAIAARHVKKKPQVAVRIDDTRVLLVEDGEANRKLVSLMLSRAGAHVTVAEHGQVAVDIVDQGGEFDVILMDMQMPVLDGYSATRELRHRGVTTPIVALTANAMQGDRQKCEAAGCSDYLTKPIDKVRLLERVSSIRATENSTTDSQSIQNAETELPTNEAESSDVNRVRLQYVADVLERTSHMRLWAGEQRYDELGQVADLLGKTAGSVHLDDLTPLVETLAENCRQRIPESVSQAIDAIESYLRSQLPTSSTV